MTTRAQVLVTAGRFVDNRPAQVSIECDGGDGFEIVLRQAGHHDTPPATTRIVLVGDHADEFDRMLAEAREAGAAAGAARQAAWDAAVSA